MNTAFETLLKKHRADFHPIIKGTKGKETFYPFDFTANNTEITGELIADTGKFSHWISKKLQDAGAAFGIGGYNENRVVYKRSKLFSGKDERTLHLGVDIWGPAGTAVHAPLGGMVHSFASNNNFGDYGATVILQHQLETVTFYTLYGHLSLADLSLMRKGKFVTRGEVIGHFGLPEQNGEWPPHLHFQLIRDIGLNEGDYPGVCSVKESAKYLANSPDANLLLTF